MSLQFLLFAFLAYGVSAKFVIENDSPPVTSLLNDDDFVPLIVGGTNAIAGEFRGKISIQYANGTHICGGTLIEERHVLTSATCVTNQWGDVIPPTTYRLLGDDLSISVETGNVNRQVRSVSHVFVHPEFNLATSDNNVAVIRVSQSFVTTLTFNPVTRSQDSPPVNTQCMVAGWGSISDNGPISFQLQRINSLVVSRAVCNAPNSYNGAVRAGMFCAGVIAGGQGTCQRDDGGGLICNNLVFGIVSGSTGCALANFPTIYTDVAVYNNWIDWTINWDEGQHDNVPTPTSITTSTIAPVPTPDPDGAAALVNSVYLFMVCIGIVLLMQN